MRICSMNWENTLNFRNTCLVKDWLINFILSCHQYFGRMGRFFYRKFLAQLPRVDLSNTCTQWVPAAFAACAQNLPSPLPSPFVCVNPSLQPWILSPLCPRSVSLGSKPGPSRPCCIPQLLAAGLWPRGTGTPETHALLWPMRSWCFTGAAEEGVEEGWCPGITEISRAVPVYCSVLWGWDTDCPLVTLPCYPFILHPLSESIHRQIRKIRFSEMRYPEGVFNHWINFPFMRTETMEGYRGKKTKRKIQKMAAQLCVWMKWKVSTIEDKLHHIPLNPFHEVLSVFLLCGRMRFMQILNWQKSH